jgi:Tfp pilus assembly protein PilN
MDGGGGVSFVRQKLGATLEDAATVESIKKENAELKKENANLKKQIAELTKAQQQQPQPQQQS